MTERELITVAKEARSCAYSNYSKFSVGAALLSLSGKVFHGCNVENRSLGLTMCAERVAAGAAISQGVRDFAMIALIADSDLPIVPCGACRQVLAEFNPEMRIVTSTLEGKQQAFSLSDLFPYPKQGILEGVQDV